MAPLHLSAMGSSFGKDKNKRNDFAGAAHVREYERLAIEPDQDDLINGTCSAVDPSGSSGAMDGITRVPSFGIFETKCQ